MADDALLIQTLSGSVRCVHLHHHDDDDDAGWLHVYRINTSSSAKPSALSDFMQEYINVSFPLYFSWGFNGLNGFNDLFAWIQIYGLSTRNINIPVDTLDIECEYTWSHRSHLMKSLGAEWRRCFLDNHVEVTENIVQNNGRRSILYIFGLRGKYSYRLWMQTQDQYQSIIL